MSEEKWSLIRRRIYYSMPYIRLILGGTTLAISDEIWQAVIGLSAVWLITSGSDFLAARHVNVSRETSDSFEFCMNHTCEILDDPKESVAEYIVRTTPNVSRETSEDHFHPYEETCDDCQAKHVRTPCAEKHGSAEAHVQGCEGWRWPLE